MMNKDEAVQKIATAGRLSIAHAEDLYDSFFPKPIVPQYVADWYEEHKEELNESIWEYLVNWDEIPWDDFKRWMSHTYSTQALTTLVNMHRFGYEVEKETRYTVQIKGIDDNYKFLNYGTSFKDWTIDDDKCANGVRVTHTRKELEDANFGWVFDCPGVEVKEVDDGND